MRKRTAMMFLILAGSGSVSGQKIDLNHQVVDYIKKSTPQASQFQKYGDIPVNANTGAVNINVPFFTVSIKNVDWNVGISYHTGGNRVSEVAGPAGLGWKLQASGLISAKIFQRCDVFVKNEADSSVYKKTMSVAPTYDPMVDIPCAYGADIGIALDIDSKKSNDDTRFQMNFLPDIFYLNAGGLNTQFFLKKDTGYCLPSKDISIVHTPGAYPNDNAYPGSWMVIDENGTKYTFEARGGSSTNYSSSVNAVDTSFASPAAHSNYNPVFVLTQIENVYGEKINLYYSTECYQYRLPDQDEYRDYTGGGQCTNSGDGFFTPSHKQGSHEICDARIDSITTTNGQSVVFKYSSRNDLIGASKLDTVSLFLKSSAAYTFLRSYKLHTGYFGTGSNPRDLRLKLDSVGEVNVSEALNARHSFIYNPEGLPSRISAAQDSSGFYNGQTGNTNLVPYYGGNRSSSLTYTKACVIEKVKYPTGGYTLIDYELKNTGGGLRVKQIKDSLDGQIVNLREYEYNSGYVVANTPFVFSKDIVTYEYVCNGPHPKIEINCPYTATFTDPLLSLADSYYGDRVERYTGVTEYFGSGGSNGKIVYEFANPNYLLPAGMIVQNELLTSKTVYKKNGSSYESVKTETKTYDVLPVSGTLFTDASNSREVRAWGLDFDKDRDAFETSATECNGYVGSLCYPYRFFQVTVRLVSAPLMVINEESSDHGPTITKQYKYGVEKKLNPISIITKDSKGNYRIEEYKYPVDYSGITSTDTVSAGIKNLITKHIYSNPVEQSVYLRNSDSTNPRLVSSVFTSFRPDLAVPYRLFAMPVTTPITNFSVSSVQSGSLTKDSRYKERILFNKYDPNGNLIEQQKINDMKYSYIRGHLGSVPLAQVSNADSTSVAYTSFEPDSKGGWIFSGSTYNGLAVTGSASYSASGGNITRSGLSSATYIVSYWGYGGSVLVNSTGPTKTGRTASGWTYYEHEITTTSITVSGSNYIDELRLYPKGAQMTTYCYSPEMLMTSQCDASNKIVYYEYDNFKRLKIIRDQDGKIVKRIDYRFLAGLQD